MKEQLKNIDERAKEELSHINDAKLLEDFRVRFLGKKGEITAILKQMGKLSAEERPVIGQLANKVREDIETAGSYLHRNFSVCCLCKWHYHLPELHDAVPRPADSDHHHGCSILQACSQLDTKGCHSIPYCGLRYLPAGLPDLSDQRRADPLPVCNGCPVCPDRKSVV